MKRIFFCSHASFGKKLHITLFFVFFLISQFSGPFGNKTTVQAAGTEKTAASTYKKTASGTWVYQSDGTYFKDKKNKYVKKSWKTIDKKKYYFDSKGKMKTGWFSYKNQKYYLHKEGHMQKGWMTLNGKTYYFNKNGIMQKGWVTLSKKKYYFHKSTGIMTTGWLKINGKKYYFNENGTMLTGWLTKDGKKYYFNSSGVMQTGSCYIKNKGYVFRSDGSLDANAKYTGINPKGKMVALTFDDGPGKYTMTLLKALEKYHAKATFFMVGSSVSSYPSTVKKMYKIGCELGNHSYDHSRLTSLSTGQIQSQISRTNTAIRSVCGHSATVMRPPYGSYDSRVLSAAGMPALFWSIDTRDWATLNTYSSVSHVKRNVRDGSIILMHDIYSTSVNAAIELIPWLQKQGYQLVTVSEMAKYRKGGLKAGRIYSNMYR